MSLRRAAALLGLEAFRDGIPTAYAVGSGSGRGEPGDLRYLRYAQDDRILVENPIQPRDGRNNQ